MFIQNNPIEGPGYLRELFERDGLDATVIGPDGGIPGSAEGPVVILGGPQSANEDSPRLRAEEELVRNCHRRDVPVLGVCLGSQLAAKALGGRVYAGGLAEMGFHDDVIPDRTSALFGGAPDPYWVFHWHQDTFELPPDAAVLGRLPGLRQPGVHRRLGGGAAVPPGGGPADGPNLAGGHGRAAGRSPA